MRSSDGYRRIRRYEIPPSVLPFCFETGARLEIIDGIPEGAHFRGYGHDYERNCIYIYLEHESFDKVHESEVVPYGHHLQVRRIYDEIKPS